jgi:anti-anti-sigma regulatory factor
MNATSNGTSMRSEAGEITIFEATAFRDALITLLANEGSVVLDLSSVERIDTSGVQILLAAFRIGRLTVAGLRPEVRRSMERIGCSIE